MTGTPLHRCTSTEILEELFLHSVNVSQSQEHFRVTPPPTRCRRSPASPCVISKICKRWRDIALNFAPLWTHLHVVDPQHVSIVQDLQVWMHRARTLPLCFSLREYQSYDTTASAAVATLFLESLHRCQSFEMFVWTDLKYFFLQNIERVPSTSLESVNVCIRYNKQGKNARFLTNLLLNTPSLHIIQWSCGFVGPIIPHSSVRNLPKFLDALSHCQNLERLRIHQPSYNRWPSTFVTLPRVTHLSFLVGIASSAILDQLVLPSLVDLELGLLYRLSWAAILNLIQRSDAMLRRLRIISGNIPRFRRLDQVEFIRILKMPYFQELRILEVEEPMVAGHDVVNFLTFPTGSKTAAAGSDPTDGTSSYLEHLERIRLVFQGTRGVKVSSALRKLIKSRLGILYDPKSAKEHIEITTHICFSLSIPSI